MVSCFTRGVRGVTQRPPDHQGNLYTQPNPTQPNTHIYRFELSKSLDLSCPLYIQLLGFSLVYRFFNPPPTMPSSRKKKERSYRNIWHVILISITFTPVKKGQRKGNLPHERPALSVQLYSLYGAQLWPVSLFFCYFVCLSISSLDAFDSLAAGLFFFFCGSISKAYKLYHYNAMALSNASIRTCWPGQPYSVVHSFWIHTHTHTHTHLRRIAQFDKSTIANPKPYAHASNAAIISRLTLQQRIVVLDVYLRSRRSSSHYRCLRWMSSYFYLLFNVSLESPSFFYSPSTSQPFC